MTAVVNEPLAAGMADGPSLPSIAAVTQTATPKSDNDRPAAGIPGLNEALIDPTSASPKKAKQLGSGRSFGRSLFVAFTAVVFAGGAGFGARMGYDWYEHREAPAESAQVAPLTRVSNERLIDPPAIRYADSVTTTVGLSVNKTVTTHLDLATGNKISNVVSSDAAGVSSVDIDLRADQAFRRDAPGQAWRAISVDEAQATIGDSIAGAVYTRSDVIPAAAAAHVTMIEETDVELSLSPIVEAPRVQPDGTPGTLPERADDDVAPSSVTHYRATVDVDAFRTSDFAAFESWNRRIGVVTGADLDFWVDGNGVVRQLSLVGDDGTTVTTTLTGGSFRSTRFDVNPLNAPGNPVVEQPVPAQPGADGVTPPAPIDAPPAAIPEGEG